MSKAVGFLHPGEMGISLAASALNSGMQVHWCAKNRSEATKSRAENLGITTQPTLQALCDTCEIIISVCPPHVATTSAENVIACNYSGILTDVNAIAPATVKNIASLASAANIDFVDGGIIGLPVSRPGTTWLYLSGAKASTVARCFASGPLETEILGEKPGLASGLKMCFAANSKGTAALHTAILGAAERLGVRETLEKQWEIYNPGFTAKSQDRIRQVARKAWRFTGEMKEIAQTLEAAGMPGEFFDAAAEVYERQASFKDVDEDPSIEKILDLVLKNNPDAT